MISIRKLATLGKGFIVDTRNMSEAERLMSIRAARKASAPDRFVSISKNDCGEKELIVKIKTSFKEHFLKNKPMHKAEERLPVEKIYVELGNTVQKTLRSFYKSKILATIEKAYKPVKEMSRVA